MVSKLKNKDSSVMSILYENYSQALFGVIHRIVNNRQASEEILQDTFYKIWSRAELYDPAKGRLFTWMLNIARNAALGYLRTKHYRIQDKIQSLESNATIIEQGNHYVDFTDTIGVKQIIEQLNTKYMEVIDQVYFKGLSHSETAAELQLPLGTVKTRLRKAILILRDLV